MRELLSSSNNQYLAFVRIVLQRERIGFRDTGDDAFGQRAILPTTVYVLNDGDYDRARAAIQRFNDEAGSTATLLPPTRSTKILSAVFIGLIALAVISLVVGFIHEAIRAYHS